LLSLKDRKVPGLFSCFWFFLPNLQIRTFDQARRDENVGVRGYYDLDFPLFSLYFRGRRMMMK
jgi:hypothetical protein